MFVLLTQGLICTGCLTVLIVFDFKHSPQILKIFRTTVERSEASPPLLGTIPYTLSGLCAVSYMEAASH